MKRTMLLCGLLAGAALAAGAQQSNANDPYQGVSTPPPDDEITTTAPARKPDAGRPLVVPPTPTAPVAVPQPTPVPEPLPVRRSQTPAPEQASSAVLQPEAERNYTHSSDPDADIVHPVEVKTVPVKPGLSRRASASLPDPDGDIVRPHSLKPTEVEEGSEIRTRLVERLSSATSEKNEVFRLRVVSEVVRNGSVLIPVDSIIEGEITQVSDGKNGGHGRSVMRLTPDTLVLPDGRHYFLRAQVTAAPGTNLQVGGEGNILPGSRLKRDEIQYGGAVGAGLATGAIVGGPAGAVAGGLIGAGAVTVHLFASPSQVVLEPGSVVVLTLGEAIDVDPAKARGN